MVRKQKKKLCVKTGQKVYY